MTNPTVTRFDIYNRADEDGERHDPGRGGGDAGEAGPPLW